MSHSTPRSTRKGATSSFTLAISSPWRRRSSVPRPGTTRTFGVWSQIARYSYPRAIAARAIDSIDALPSDHRVWQWRSPRMRFRFDEAARRLRAGRLTQLRRAVREAQALEQLELVARGRQRLEWLNVRG